MDGDGREGVNKAGSEGGNKGKGVRRRRKGWGWKGRWEQGWERGREQG